MPRSPRRCKTFSELLLGFNVRETTDPFWRVDVGQTQKGVFSAKKPSRFSIIQPALFHAVVSLGLCAWQRSALALGAACCTGVRAQKTHTMRAYSYFVKGGAYTQHTETTPLSAMAAGGRAAPCPTPGRACGANAAVAAGRQRSALCKSALSQAGSPRRRRVLPDNVHLDMRIVRSIRIFLTIRRARIVGCRVCAPAALLVLPGNVF